MNLKKISAQALIAFSLIATSLVSCDNESDTNFNSSGSEITQKSNNFQQFQDIAQGLGNSLTQDSSLDPNEAIHFSNVDEFKVWANDLDKQFDGEIEVPNIKLTSGDCGDGMYTGSIGAGFGTLYFNVTVAGGKVTGVGSTYGGWHLGTTWSQGSFVQKGNKVIVTGSFNYNLLLVDDSCFYTQYVTFVITLPC